MVLMLYCFMCRHLVAKFVCVTYEIAVALVETMSTTLALLL